MANVQINVDSMAQTVNWSMIIDQRYEMLTKKSLLFNLEDYY